MAGPAARWREKGEHRDCTVKLGLAFHQGIQVELLEPVQGSEIHKDSLEARGKPIGRIQKWTGKRCLEG